MIIALIAGEMSGDLLGAGLIQALKIHYPTARFVGIGGEKMQAVGLETWFPLDALAVMGIVDVLKRLPKLLWLRHQLFRRLLKIKPDVMIGIDAPDFNLGLEKKLKLAGIKTVHYVSPSVWAWRQGRIKTIQKSVDLMLTLFPFEADFYRQHKVAVKFVGHPLADLIELESAKDDLRPSWGYAADDRVLAILPGSRGGELTHIGPELIQAVQQLHQIMPNLKFITPLANAARQEQFEYLLEQILGEQLPNFPWRRVEGHAHTLMALADCVVLASGTATLEALLLKKPMVVVYKWAKLTHYLIAPFVKSRFIALPNLLADRLLVPELVQEQCVSASIVAAVLEQLEQVDQPLLMQEFLNIHQQLRLNASQEAATAIVNLLATSS